MTPIALVRVAGTHREAGAQLGAATSIAIRRAVARVDERHLGAAAGYRDATLRHLPWIVHELDAAAEAAGADPLAVFAASVEELHLDEQAAATVGGGCTDVVVEPELTADGHRLVGHTNDLYARDEEDVVAVEWRVDGEPAVFTIGVGPWLSVGWNEAGLSVTGNELTPNDERVGLPRLLQMRDVVTRRTLDDARAAVLHPARASSYNWVLATPEGALNIEGSATAAATTAPADGTLAHTNHYVEPGMLAYEGDPEYANRSAVRHGRACRLVAGLRPPVTPDALRALLADHEHAPDSICRHGEDPDAIKTVFWCVADVSARLITYGRGNPCESEPQTYAFA